MSDLADRHEFATPLHYARLSADELVALIEQRKHDLNAVILGHNYQRVEIQEVSDYVGDSFGLAQAAAETEADVIVFCGVNFMAETAKILSPDKRVLMPDPRAGCPMADFATGEALRQLKARYPDSAVIAYVNSSAEVKAEADVCCTSSNAVRVVQSIPLEQPIIFVPDRHLGDHVARQTQRPIRSATFDGAMASGRGIAGEIIAWEGYCYVHDDLVLDELEAARQRYPGAPVVVHPEARRELLERADCVASTSMMVDLAARYDQLILGTERGLVERLQQQYPNKTIVPVSRAAICGNMKLNTLPKLAWCLDYGRHEVLLDDAIRVRAERALRRMLELADGSRAPAEEERPLERAGAAARGCACD